MSKSYWECKYLLDWTGGNFSRTINVNGSKFTEEKLPNPYYPKRILTKDANNPNAESLIQSKKRRYRYGRKSFEDF
jgi:hypothetical protein